VRAQQHFPEAEARLGAKKIKSNAGHRHFVCQPAKGSFAAKAQQKEAQTSQLQQKNCASPTPTKKVNISPTAAKKPA
jgi:hypothetical protein